MNFKNPFTIIRIGLALVFFSNGLAAFLAPQEFRELVENSFVTRLLPIPIPTFSIIIGINDLLVSLLLFFNIPKLKYVLIWACLWLIGVMIVIAEPFAILEHLGFLSIALALLLNP